jgi:glycosyltransferase involved in cell wall biosynthesis
MPNKIYDFMGAGIPVVASDSKPMSRLLTSESCGATFRSGDPVDLSRAILQMHDEGPTMGRAGIKAVKDMYNWEKDKSQLLEVVDGLCVPARKM